MKNSILLGLFFMAISLEANAQTEVASTIEKVKVFKQNAQITRDLSFNTSVGTQEFVLTGISTRIIPSSLQIQFDSPNAMLLSAKYENNYLKSKVNNKQIEDLKNQLERVNEELAVLNDQKLSLAGMEAILTKNQDLGTGNASFTPQQVIQLTESYQAKFLEIKKFLREVAKKEKPLREKANNIQQQLNELNAKFNKPSGNIILLVDSKSAINLKVQCKYIVNNVGWYPVYDIRSASINENVQLNYKANVYQNTGVDWEDVSVTISTGNPVQNNNRPILNPLYANIYEPQIYRSNDMEEAEVVSMSNMVMTKADGYAENVQVDENQLNIDFNIVKNQTINSDGKENLIGLKTYDLTTEYIYHTVPKLNDGAFLLAKISDWSQYNLVSGKANIFFEGGFVGNSQINPQVTSNELLLSMGRDNSIVVERLPIKDYESSKFIGANQKETIGYEIIVKNKKSVPIEIELLDQIPVSQNKDIEVKLEEKGSAEYTEDNGKLLWTLNIEPRQTKKEKFIYSVKYPKDKNIIGIK
jgi:uncharacterized protein (TIGR02231 family)